MARAYTADAIQSRTEWHCLQTFCDRKPLPPVLGQMAGGGGNCRSGDKRASRSVHTKRIFVLWQGKNVFYAGSILLWYSTEIKNIFNAAREQKDLRVNRPSRCNTPANSSPAAHPFWRQSRPGLQPWRLPELCYRQRRRAVCSAGWTWSPAPCVCQRPCSRPG